MAEERRPSSNKVSPLPPSYEEASVKHINEINGKDKGEDMDKSVQEVTDNVTEITVCDDDEDNDSGYPAVPDSDEEYGSEEEDEGEDEGGPPPTNVSLDKFQGYEDVGAIDQVVYIPPPSNATYEQTGERPPDEFEALSILTEAECRHSLLSWAAENCCYGKKAAREHTITQNIPTNALHYTLETFTESRASGYVYEPYYGQPIDGPENGAPPEPWHIPCIANNMFTDHVQKVEVPHTACVRGCFRCNSRGWRRCGRCHGRGRVKCARCHGTGKRVIRQKGETRRITCEKCKGRGRRKCTRCGGEGQVLCPICEGYCDLKYYLQLTVTFTNHLSDYILEETDMPDELVRDVGGRLIFEQAQPLVWPLKGYPVNEVNENSELLCASHKKDWPSELILQQRHRLRVVQVTEVHYQWKNRQSRYWVYGDEMKVYCPDYPQTCCWGCSVM